MFRFSLIAGLLISGSALAAPSYDIRTSPTGVAGNAPVHVDDNDGGQPVIHRPEGGPSASNGVGRMEEGDASRTVTYSGRGRGTFGSRTSPAIATNDEGRPQLRYSN